MKTAVDRAYVEEGVKEVLVISLGVEKDEVTDRASITYDLGAESIDYLDIEFRLKNQFDIKVSKAEMFPSAWQGYNDPMYCLNGNLTREGIASLKEDYPHVNFNGLENDPTREEIIQRENVNSIVEYIERRLNG